MSLSRSAPALAPVAPLSFAPALKPRMITAPSVNSWAVGSSPRRAVVAEFRPAAGVPVRQLPGVSPGRLPRRSQAETGRPGGPGHAARHHGRAGERSPGGGH